MTPARPQGRRPLRPRAPIVALAAAGLLLLVPSALAVDLTPPVVAPNVTGTLGANGWYTTSVTVTWNFGDLESGISNADCPIRTLDEPGGSVTCSASNPDGLTTTITVTIKVDKTAPQVTGGTPERGPDANGWYNHAVTFSFTGSDALSGIESCGSAGYAGPDSASASVTGTCRDKAGNVGSRAVAFQYDAGAPALGPASLERAPDANGWYNHPVAFSFTGSDPVSGIESCSSVTYSGPDNPDAAVAGTCRDKAGNVGSLSATIKYDATPPVLSGVRARGGDGVETIEWSSTSDSDVAVVSRSARGRAKAARVVFRGAGSRYEDRKIEDGLEYRYVVQTFDLAGNPSNKVALAAFPMVLTLRKLAYVPHVTAPPILRWRAAPRATYYHVQLLRGTKRILASWPVRPELTLPRTWVYESKRRQLQPGRYRWYAWVGLGPRKAQTFRRLGKGEFIVLRTPKRG